MLQAELQAEIKKDIEEKTKKVLNLIEELKPKKVNTNEEKKDSSINESKSKKTVAAKKTSTYKITNKSEKDNTSKNDVYQYMILATLEKIYDVLSKQIPIGKVINIPDGISLTAGDTYVDLVNGIIVKPDHTKRTIPVYHKALFSISIENEGDSDCVVAINPEENWGKRNINNGETYELDMKAAVIKMLKLTVGIGGSCTVQITGVV